MVADQRGHRRPETRVADAHAHTAEQELGKARGCAAGGDHAAEHGHAHRHDPGPVHPLGHARQGQAQQGVEDGEAQPEDETDLAVGQVQVRLDRRRRHRHALAVGEVKGVDQQEDEQQPAPVALGKGRRGFGRFHGVG